MVALAGAAARGSSAHPHPESVDKLRDAGSSADAARPTAALRPTATTRASGKPGPLAAVAAMGTPVGMATPGVTPGAMGTPLRTVEARPPATTVGYNVKYAV